MTDSGGHEIRRLAYTAFGEEIENTGSGDAPAYTYTGKELDDSGLLYYGARYYDPDLSRFITPDSIYDVGPQGLNRYSYALNNPIKYYDPTGHFVMGDDDENDPEAYGSITGSQEQLNEGTATVHDGGDSSQNQTVNKFDRGGAASFPANPRNYASPYPNRKTSDAGLTLLHVAASVACEPYDWGNTFYRWSQGDFSWWDLFGLAPLIPATVGKYVDDAEELVLKASKTDWRIGNRSIKSIVGDATVMVDGVPTKVNPGIQSYAARSKIEDYARMMATGKPKKFDWNNMRVPEGHLFKVPGTPDPLIFRRLSNGELQIVEGHHRFIAAKMVGIEIPTSNPLSVDFQDVISGGGYGKIWENMDYSY